VATLLHDYASYCNCLSSVMKVNIVSVNAMLFCEQMDIILGVA